MTNEFNVITTQELSLEGKTTTVFTGEIVNGETVYSKQTEIINSTPSNGTQEFNIKDALTKTPMTGYKVYYNFSISFVEVEDIT